MTQNTDTIVGRIPQKSGKKPKSNDDVRVCAEKNCETKLSRYNTKDMCFRHRPARFPRVRGRPR